MMSRMISWQVRMIWIDSKKFIFSGLTTIIGQTIDNPEAPQPPELFRRELGVGILATLNRLKTRKS